MPQNEIGFVSTPVEGGNAKFTVLDADGTPEVVVSLENDSEEKVLARFSVGTEILLELSVLFGAAAKETYGCSC